MSCALSVQLRTTSLRFEPSGELTRAKYGLFATSISHAPNVCSLSRSERGSNISVAFNNALLAQIAHRRDETIWISAGEVPARIASAVCPTYLPCSAGTLFMPNIVTCIIQP